MQKSKEIVSIAILDYFGGEELARQEANSFLGGGK